MVYRLQGILIVQLFIRIACLCLVAMMEVIGVICTSITFWPIGGDALRRWDEFRGPDIVPHVWCMGIV